MTELEKELANALHALLDEQNGVPLLSREMQWEEAVRKSRAVLAKIEYTQEVENAQSGKN